MRIYLNYILFILSLGAYSQGFIARHSLPSSSTHLTKAVFENSPGNYFGAGFEVDSTDGYTSLCIMGLGNQGQLLWVKKYGNVKFQYLDDPFTCRSFYKQGSFIYHAGSALDSNNKFSGVLIKFNQNGDTIWQRIYRDTVNGITPQMVTGSVDGGFLITGFVETQVSRLCLLIKTDASGYELWRKNIAKTTVPNHHDGKAIIQDSASKKIIIVGYQDIGNAISWTPFDNVLILDILGNKIIQQRYGYGGDLLDLIQTKDKKFVAVGNNTSTQIVGNYSEYTSYIVKFDVNNPTNCIWKNVYFDPVATENLFSDIVELKNGDLLIGGNIDTLLKHNLTSNSLTRFVKMDSNGTLIWKRYYDYNNLPGNANYQGIVDFHLTSDNGWIAAIEDPGQGNRPFLFVKYDSTGCDSSLLYCQLFETGIAKNYLQEKVISIYPNPSASLIYISLLNTEQSDGLILIIRDILGRELKSFKLNNSKDEQVVDLSDVAPGVYFANIIRNKQSVYTSKLIRSD